jgi:regulator of RNase E activity RraA
MKEMFFELRDYVSGDTCGVIRVTHIDNDNNPEEEIEESWTEFNQLEEHELDSYNVDDFVKWHNEGRVTQIERIKLTIIQPQ